MDLGDTILLKDSTKWLIVGSFMLLGTIFFISRSCSSDPNNPTGSVSSSNETKSQSTLVSHQSGANDQQAPLVCDSEGCTICDPGVDILAKQKSSTAFGGFDPTLVAIADETKDEKADETKASNETEELKQARDSLKATIEETDDPLLNGGKRIVDKPVEKKDKDVFAVEQSNEKKESKPLLTFVEKVPLESEEWKKLSAEEKIARYLKMKVTCDESGISLEELADQLTNSLDVEVTVDQSSLEEASYDTATRHMIKSKRPRPLKSILSQSLNDHSLAYIVKNDALVLTSQAKQKEEMIVKVYPVADLVTAPTASDYESAEHDYESLINLIQTTVQPKTWKEVSGDDNGGTIDRHDPTLVLVVRNTNEALDELEDFFIQLRTMKSPSARRLQKIADLPLEQPDKIVRRIYYITDQPQFGKSGAGAGRRGPVGGFGGGGMGARESGGMSGGSSNPGGLFAISAEKIQHPSPKTLSISGHSTIAADFLGGGQPAQQPTPNPPAAATASGLSATPTGQPAPTPPAVNQPAQVPETRPEFLNAAQMKARMESLVDIIPGTVDPANWDKEKTNITNMENRLIVINTAASQIEIEKLLRGLKVLARVEAW